MHFRSSHPSHGGTALKMKKISESSAFSKKCLNSEIQIWYRALQRDLIWGLTFMGCAHNWKHKFVTRCPWDLILCRLLILVFYSSWGCDITVGKGAYYSMVLSLILENSKNVKQLETWCSHNNLAAAAHKRHCLQNILQYNDWRALFTL